MLAGVLALSGDRRSTYRPDIDGLRALAVMLVVLNHAGLGFPGGYIGVDVFFVISGYLITGILLRELAQGTFSFWAFWERRIRRIFPALFVATACTVVAGYRLLLPPDFFALGKSVVAATLGYSNIHFWGESGYFDTATAEKPLLHTWSLAVEEQFYLFIPLLLFALAKTGRQRWTRSMLSILFAISLLSACWLVWRRTSFTFYWLPTRAWELLAGSLLAMAPALPDRQSRRRDLLAWAGLALILLPACLYTKDTLFPGPAAILPVLGAVLLIATGGGAPTTVHRGLEWKPVVFIGTISYSLYLVHWPPIAFANYFALVPPPWWTRAGLVAASLVLATLSWWLVETPFRGKRLLADRRLLFAGFVAGCALLVVTGKAIKRNLGLPDRMEGPVQELLTTRNMDERWLWSKLDPANLKAGLLPFGAEGDSPRVFMWGDSHAKSIMPALHSICRKNGVTGIAALHSGVPPVADYPYPSQDFSPSEYLELSGKIFQTAVDLRVTHLVIAGFWERHASFNPDAMRDCLLHMARDLRARGITLCFVKDVPCFPVNPSKLALYLKSINPRTLAGLTDAQYSEQNSFQNRVLPELEAAGVVILDPLPYLKKASQSNDFLPVDAKGFIYCDTNHLSAYGAMQVQGAFEPLFD